MTDPSTQLLHAQTLISLLHPSPTAATMVEITGLAPKQRPIKRYFTRTDLAAEYAIELNNMRFSAFVNANPRSAMSGFERDVPVVTALALDLQPERTSIEDVAARLARAGIAPTATVVSGYGAHFYLRVAPEDPHKAKVVWERLCRYTGSDPIFSTNRIMRMPGTLNWKKDPPRWCFLTGVWPERSYTVTQVDAALDWARAEPARSPKSDIIPVPIDPPGDYWELRRRLSAGVLDIIDTGEKNAYSEKQVTRSEADWVVVCALVCAGASDEMIHWTYANFPVRLLKYYEAGARYLTRTIEAARRATAAPVERAPTRRPACIPMFTGGSGDRNRSRNASRQYR